MKRLTLYAQMPCWPAVIWCLQRWLLAATLLGALLMGGASARAADWQVVPSAVPGQLLVDAESVLWVNGRARAWVWYEPAHRSTLGWLLFGSGGMALAGGKELVQINCAARSYRIAELEGLPRDARYLGRAMEVLPDSVEAAVLDWLCHA